MSTLVARGIRFGITAARTPAMWPVIILMPWTLRAFDREFDRRTRRLLYPVGRR